MQIYSKCNNDASAGRNIKDTREHKIIFAHIPFAARDPDLTGPA
jgi:hypothetical protein